jgi:ubiquinone/menaquinone biosynthesis C-methylase UbiE
MKLYHELAEHYFAIEKNHRDISRDVSFIAALIVDRKHPALLDLGCGTGEHLALLVREGIRCTGVDISEDMLAAARRRFPNIEFIHSDMSDIDYDAAFDIVISLFGSFDYLINDADIESMLLKMRKSLKPGGTGVLEIWNSPPILKIKNKGIGPVSTTIDNGVLIKRERGFKLRNDPFKTVVEVNYQYTIDGDGLKIVRDRHVMRTFTTAEITRFLAGAGFTVKNIFANFLSEPYDENSNRMVVVFGMPSHITPQTPQRGA